MKVTKFYQWCFLEYILFWKNIILFLFHYFSIELLLRTLFSPWKRSLRVKQTPGFSFNEFWERFTFNVISRIIGCCVRFVTINVGLLIIVISIISSFISIVFIPFFIPYLFRRYSLMFEEQMNLSLLRNVKTQDEFVRFLFQTNSMNFIIKRLNLKKEIIYSALEQIDYISLQNFDNAASLYLSIFLHTNLKSVLLQEQITQDDISNVLKWLDFNESNKKRTWWDRDTLLRKPSIGKTWSYGYTLLLDTYTVDLSQQPLEYEDMKGWEDLIVQIESTLLNKISRNIFLTGDAGVGKHALITYFAHKIFEGTVMPQLEGWRVLRFDIEKISGTGGGNKLSLKEIVSHMLEEARLAGNIILVFDGLGNLLRQGEETLDLTDVFSHELQSGRFCIIGIMTPDEYHAHVEQNIHLKKYFTELTIREPNVTETLLLLCRYVGKIESEMNIFISYQALKSIVQLTDQYQHVEVFPQKAFHLLERVVNTLSSGAILTSDIVAHEYEKIIGIPLSIDQQRKDLLNNLEQTLEYRIIGQPYACRSVSLAIKRTWVQVKKISRKPIGTFLFLGPTGVGKTETAKVLADILFGSENKLIRMDMNEFQDSNAIAQFIGDFETQRPGVFIELLKEQPASIILLDEFEKAHPDVFNLFLSLLDEGYITDAFGKQVYATNCILIATSNAGSSEFFLHNTVDNDDQNSNKYMLNLLIQKNIFSPELLNRFDDIILFQPLSMESIEQVFDRKIAIYKKELQEMKGIDLLILPQTKELVIKNGWDEHYGGRALNRSIQQFIEDKVAEKLLKNEIENGKLLI